MRDWPERLRSWALRLKRDLTALWIAVRSPETPLPAKLVAAVTVAYALSPIDLVPDFIPVLGYLDDLLIVPLGIWLALRLTPPALVERLRAEAAATPWPARNFAGAFLVVAIWLAALYGLAKALNFAPF